MAVRFRHRALWCAAFATMVSMAHAFEPGPPRPQTELALPADPPASGLTMPQGSEGDVSPSPDALREGLAVFVRAFEFSGNTVVDNETLQAIATPYLNRAVNTEELSALRQALTRHYVEHGYVNSGALIPDQTVSNGTIKIDIVEGRLSAIEVHGNRRLRERYLIARLARGAGTPLNVNSLQEQLQLLLAGPFVSRINGELAPGRAPGEAVLRAAVEERRPYQLVAAIDNDVTPSLGDVHASLQGSYLNPSGWGDIASAELGYAEGSKEAQINYALPLNALGSSAEVYGNWSEGEVVEERLRGLDIQGETLTAGTRLTHLFAETPRNRWGVSLGFDVRRSTTSLLGRGFAFSPGVEPDGDSQVSVLRLGQEWTRRSAEQVLALRSVFSVGVDVFGATRNRHGLPDGRFVAWLGQAQWVRRVPWFKSQLVFRLDGQWAADPLLPLEQFAAGGARTVRGYAKNVLVRDHGFATSLEWRVPILRDKDQRTRLEFAPFVDAGGAWFENREGPAPNIIPALGFGLRADPHPKIHAEFYWGYALKGVPGKGESPQEHGVYFSLVADVFR